MTAARAASAAQVAATWTVLLLLWAAAAWLLLSGPVGRQALVDERVRVVDTIGGTVNDAASAAPPCV